MRFLLVLLPLLASAEIRVGIIGTDTSHATAFTALLNDPSNPKHIPGAKVVAAYKGGSSDLPASAKRVDQYADELVKRWGVKLYDDIPSMCRDVDAILLESVDGRPHLAQARLAFAANKPVFIDKPLASTFADAQAIAKLARDNGVPWFSASSLRWVPLVEQLKSPSNKSVTTWGPAELEPTHQLDLSWYGIHAVELLYALLGPGCEEVTRTVNGDVETVTGKWGGGRIGTVQLLRPDAGFGAVAIRGPKVAMGEAPVDYAPMLREIVKFFETRQPPVAPEETLEIFAFMDAALRSKQQGGRPVKLSR
jgi:predicted dehydrogenase